MRRMACGTAKVTALFGSAFASSEPNPVAVSVMWVPAATSVSRVGTTAFSTAGTTAIAASAPTVASAGSTE